MGGDARTRHPFFMYDAVRGQPAAVARVAERLHGTMDDLTEWVASCDRLFLVGTGTSFHAALAGEHILRAYARGVRVRPYPAFDFALYGPVLGPQDCVIAISHRGNKTYTVQSLARAREAGCRTALITGEPGTGAARPAVDAVFETVPQERSSTHTISYTTAMAALAVLAGGVGTPGQSPGPALGVLTEDIPAAMRAGLDLETEMASWARAHLHRRRIWLAGGGPSAITAAEIALKIKEAAYLQAEGAPVETLLHGPFQSAEPEDAVVLIAPAGAAQARVLQLATMAADIGAVYLIVTDAAGAEPAEPARAGAAGWCVVPAVPEAFTTLSCLVPLQLFSYHLALARGTNPDGFRLDDPRFAKARARIQL